MKTMRLVGYLLLVVALVVSCKKDEPEPDANIGLLSSAIFSGFKRNV